MKIFKSLLLVVVLLVLSGNIEAANIFIESGRFDLVLSSDGQAVALVEKAAVKRLLKIKNIDCLFTVELLENVYGLDDGKRRIIGLKSVSQNGDLIKLAPAKGELPRFTFKATDKGSYLTLELVSMENPEKEHATVLTMQRIDGTNWMPLDGVTKKTPRLGNNPSFFGVLQRSKDNPLGGIALWYPKNDEDDDEILYDVWANENMPHPKVEGEWTVARAKKWISDYIDIVCKTYTTQMYIGPRKPEDLKPLADKAAEFGMKKVYMHLNTWGDRYWASDRDNFEVSEKIFPGGRKDMVAFGKYLESKGMKLTFRTISYGLGEKHPEYLGKIPDARLAYWWRGKLAKNTDRQSQEIVVAEGREHSTEYDSNRKFVEVYDRHCMQIGNELVTFTEYTNNGDGTWTLKGCKRGFGNTDAVSHVAGEQARGLYRTYGIAFAPDPDSTLMEEMAKRFGEFHNEVNAGSANFDALEVHAMMFHYGTTKFMGEVYRNIDHPVYGSTSGGDMTWGFIEGKFHSVQNAMDTTRNGRSVGIPWADDMKIGLHQSHWSASSPYAYCWAIPARTAASLRTAITAQAGFHDITMDIFNGHGLIDHYGKTFNQWRTLGPKLPQAIKKRIFSSWYENPWSSRYSLVDEIFRFEGEGDALSVVPFRIMKREGIDRGWTFHQEHGTVYPYQYIRPGEVLRVNNPYHSQVPEFIVRVMPDFNRDIALMRLKAKGESKEEKKFNDMLDKFQGASGVTIEKRAAKNLSGQEISYRIMPDPANIQQKGQTRFVRESKGVRISCQNDTGKVLALVKEKSDTMPWYKVKTDITKAGGMGIVVTGDGSGAILVIRISGQGTRDYIVHLDFKGKRYIEIPTPQASWTDARWPFLNAYKRWRGNSITKISLGIDRIKPHSKSSVLIEDLRFLPEKDSALVNPEIKVGDGKIKIKGTVPSDRYLWYQGGNSVGVYDLNWNKLEDLPVVLDKAEAPAGYLDIEVTNHNKKSAPWLEVQFFVHDEPMFIKK